MIAERSKRRNLPPAFIVSIFLCLLGCHLAIVAPSSALAASFVPTLTQYAHTVWRVQDGEIGGQPYSITQSRDGYLWVGTEDGLEIYDGTHFRNWPLPNDGPVFAVHAARDGSLWVGRESSVLHIQDGRPTPISVGNGRFYDFYEDSSGAIWLARTRGPPHSGGLCKLQNAVLRCFGLADGQLCDFGSAITQDASGEFWIGSEVGACRWRQGVGSFLNKHIDNPRSFGAITFLADSDGSMLVGFVRSGPHLGLQQTNPLGTRPFTADGFNGEEAHVAALFRDRDGGLWIGTLDKGIYHVNHGKVDRFTSADGLSSNTVNAFFEDREGNVWVATSGGIDRFHQRPVSAITTREGLAVDRVHSVLGRPDGSILIGTLEGLDILRDGGVEHLREDRGLPGHSVTSMLEDHTGKVWLGVDNKLAVYNGKTFQLILKGDGSSLGTVVGLAEDERHDIWVMTARNPYRLYRIRNGAYFDEIYLPSDEIPGSLATGPDGRIRVLSQGPKLFDYEAGNFEAIPAPGLGKKAQQLSMLSNGDIFLSGPDGVYYLSRGRSLMLDRARGLPCDAVISVTEVDQNAFWLRAKCGIIIVAKSDLERVLERPREKLRVRFLDGVDGALPGEPSFMPAVTKSPDGRLWFATDGVLLTADPAHLLVNKLPPPVHIEQVIADHRVYGLAPTISLPPRTRDVEIDYAGLSLIAPQKMHFRYRLSGLDDEWQDVGTRRAAFYMNLKPGHYHFQVIASNNDGVWNMAGDDLSLSIRPAFYQTIWFQTVAVALLLGLLWLALVLRVRYATAEIEARLSERQAERIRIARELHDTLLQGFQGLLVRFQVATDAMPQSSVARQMMEVALDRAEEVLIEGRERVADLRSNDDDGSTLIEELKELASDLDRYGGAPIGFDYTGIPRGLRPGVQGEILAIAKEALTNACRHSQASTIFCHLTFTHSRLLLVCGDNGIGIDAETIKVGRREGHWGLTGMHERARKIGGVLQIHSAPGQTRVELNLNIRMAYLRQVGRRLLLWATP